MADNVEEYNRKKSSSWFAWLLSPLLIWIKWKPTTMTLLAEAEIKVLSHIKELYKGVFVPICNNQKRIWTIVTHNNENNDKATPLVMVHGFGGGVGLWTLNLTSLSRDRVVYAFDVLGFGRSSRPNFSRDAHLAEGEFVDSIEDWRRKLNLENFILLGHSFGSYLATSYSIRYPDRVKHLILTDPWGFPERPVRREYYMIPIWVKAIAVLLKPFNPLAGLRAAGPWGPSLVERFRPDMKKKFGHVLNNSEDILKYIYHCNAQTPSGETAFANMSIPFGWAKHPMINRLHELPCQTPITMIYGAKSWMECETGYLVQGLRPHSYVDVQVITGAGHHVYADKPDIFNEIVNKVGQAVDKQLL